MFDLKKLIEILTQWLDKQDKWKRREEAIRIMVPIYTSLKRVYDDDVSISEAEKTYVAFKKVLERIEKEN